MHPVKFDLDQATPTASQTSACPTLNLFAKVASCPLSCFGLQTRCSRSEHPHRNPTRQPLAPLCLVQSLSPPRARQALNGKALPRLAQRLLRNAHLALVRLAPRQLPHRRPPAAPQGPGLPGQCCQVRRAFLSMLLGLSARLPALGSHHLAGKLRNGSPRCRDPPPGSDQSLNCLAHHKYHWCWRAPPHRCHGLICQLSGHQPA